MKPHIHYQQPTQGRTSIQNRHGAETFDVDLKAYKHLFVV